MRNSRSVRRELWHTLILLYICVYGLWVAVAAQSTTRFLNTPEQTLLTPSNARADANFGNSLSVYGNTLAVGAPGDNQVGFSAGAVYMYDYASDEWQERSQLVASSTTTGDKFGFSVSIFEDTLAVGASSKSRVIGGLPAVEAGMVHIFLRHGSAWSENQRLEAYNGQAMDHFGISVSLYDNSILIGASDDEIDVSGTAAGSVYLFRRSAMGSNFLELNTVHASDAAHGDKFGFAVDLNGDTAVVGAYQDDDQGSRSGSVYTYNVGGSSFIFQQKITAFDHNGGNNGRDAFGFSLSIVDHTLAISAFFDDDSGSESGAVYVYTRGSESTLWTAQTKLTNSDVGASGAFGFSVDLDSDELAVGATGHNNEAGATYVYQRSAGSNGDWSLKWTIKATDAQSDDSLGYAVAIENTHVVTSAPDNDDNQLRDSGSVYYIRNVDTPTSEPSLSTAPSFTPTEMPSASPSSSTPSLRPISSAPSAVPSTSSPSHLFPSSEPSLNPTAPRPSESSDEESVLEPLYIVLGVVFGGAILIFFCLHLYGSARRALRKKMESDMSPVTAEVQIVRPSGPAAGAVTPRRELSIASVYAIEPITPSPRKKKKRKGSSQSDGTSSSSVTPVLPYATHVGDHIPVAEPDIV